MGNRKDKKNNTHKHVYVWKKVEVTEAMSNNTMRNRMI